MDQPRSARRRKSKSAKKDQNGTAPEDKTEEIDDWLLGGESEPEEPRADHRIRMLVAEYQKANNTRWLAAHNLRIGKDLDDEGLISDSRATARRVRAMMDAAIDGILGLWGDITPAQRDELTQMMPGDITSALETPVRTPQPEAADDPKGVHTGERPDSAGN